MSKIHVLERVIVEITLKLTHEIIKMYSSDEFYKMSIIVKDDLFK